MLTTVLDGLSVVLLLVGVGFYTVATIGLLRLPDLRTRLHALTKADNLGLGFVVLGLMPHMPSVPAAGKMLLVWLLAMLASAVIAHLLARPDPGPASGRAPRDAPEGGAR